MRRGGAPFLGGDFLKAYENASTVGLLPHAADARRGLLELFLLDKAFYEVAYEAANRPGWLPIPLRGVLDLLAPLPEEDADRAAGGCDVHG